MIVTVKLVGVFRIDRFKEQRFSLVGGSRAADVVETLELSRRLLGIILINGTHASEEDQLQDGDCLTLMPLIEGG
ncbi:MAG: hypothetical protein BA874_04315 [Desulfuromonadales bacterium C00003068]|jgi:sulfur carrier protein ThiS|nr:MoaD/ThiS family protein [Deltaproteobacteria bacterium]OEU75739.1 MAG: hypothetical protein BA874_04315 [Desulfuromonadales bacterium C00003068]